MSNTAKVITGVILTPIAIVALMLLSLVIGSVIALVGVPIVMLAWNLGLVTALAQFGVAVSTIGFWQAFGIGFLLMTLRSIFHSVSPAQTNDKPSARTTVRNLHDRVAPR